MSRAAVTPAMLKLIGQKMLGPDRSSIIARIGNSRATK
jgi:hypothetical protein